MNKRALLLGTLAVGVAAAVRWLFTPEPDDLEFDMVE